MHHQRLSQTPGSNVCDVNLFHAMNLENSVFGVGPVSLSQDGFIPRDRSRVKMKLKLDAICSPAMDHAGEHLAPVVKFSLLT
jgi:hypothetical protein